MGTQAGYAFATGMEYIKFDQVLEIIRSYKEDFEKEIKLAVPVEDPKESLAAELFGGVEPEDALAADLFGVGKDRGSLTEQFFGATEVREPHFCNPYEGEIAFLAVAMELVELSRELTVKAITNDDIVLAALPEVMELVGLVRDAVALVATDDADGT